MTDSTRGDWPRVSALLDRLLDLEPAERERVLERECGSDAALRRRVAALLAADGAGSLLDARGAADYLALDTGDDGVSPPDDGVPEPFPAGTHVGPYRVVRELGRGGMGTVLLAERADGHFEQRVALKVVKRGMDSDDILRRFTAERQILARLEHPNIARLLDGGVTGDGRPWFALEYVEGQGLLAACAEREITLRERLELLLGVCRAVEYAHQRLIVHRDLKPANILVTPAGQVKLLDFGIAKLLSGADDAEATVTGLLPLTPAYAAPEQLRGEPVTTATDVYALGLLLHELLTGERPARGRPPAPGHGDLGLIVSQALREEPERRYASAAALRADVEHYLGGRPVSARPYTLAYRARKFVRRHRVGVVAAAGALAALLAGVAGILWQARIAQREGARAQAVTAFLMSIFKESDPDRNRGEKLTALELLDRGAARIDAELAGQPETAAEMSGVVGTLYQSLGQYQRAAPLLERSLAQRRRLFGPSSLPVAESSSRLADLHMFSGDMRAAEPLLRESLAIRTRRLGRDHADTLRDAEWLARLLVEQGRYDEARTLITDTAARVSRTQGEENEAYAGCLVTLQMLHSAVGDVDENERLLRRLLDLQVRLHGERHSQVTTTLTNLGVSAFARGEYAEAERLQRRALDGMRGLYGDDNPLLASDISNLALSVGAQGRHDDAAELSRQALQLAARAVGPDHPSLAVYVHGLGSSERRRGRAREALAHFERALDMLRRGLGEKHPHAAAAHTSKGLALHDLGRNDEAVAEFEHALALLRGHGLGRHPRAAAALEGLGRVLLARDRLERAEPLLREAVELRLASVGAAARVTAQSRVLLAQCLARRGHADEARTLLQAAVPVIERPGGTDDDATRAAAAREAAALLASLPPVTPPEPPRAASAADPR